MSYKKIVKHTKDIDGEEYYTIYHLGETGGPIITADTLEEAEADYKIALQLYEFVRKTLLYSAIYKQWKNN